MKNKKISKVFITAVILVLSLSIITVFASYEHKENDTTKIIDNVVYTLSNDKKGNACYYVSEFGYSDQVAAKMTEINIASEIDGIPVTKIDTYGQNSQKFKYPLVEKIVIPESVTEIGESAFRGLTAIKSIDLPDNLNKIGRAAFYGLENLTEISIPKNIGVIPEKAFGKCTNLKRVVFEGNVFGIDNYAFYECKQLSDITQSETLDYINERAFYGCESLRYFEFPSTLDFLGSFSFSKTSLTTVSIPDGVILETYDKKATGGQFMDCKKLKSVFFEGRFYSPYIPRYFLANCESLQSVVFPPEASGITIYESAFKKCVYLRTVANSENIDYIGAEAFMGCKRLKNITLSPTVYYIEDKAFYGCKSLTAVFLKKYYWATDYLPCIDADAFGNTSDGIKFMFDNDRKDFADQLKTNLKGSGVKNARIFLPTNKRVYSSING
ncbi:MAG: leucine-rich repeat domain-containing protein [Acutalibacteraceae bacterium]